MDGTYENTTVPHEKGVEGVLAQIDDLMVQQRNELIGTYSRLLGQFQSETIQLASVMAWAADLIAAGNHMKDSLCARTGAEITDEEFFSQIKDAATSIIALKKLEDEPEVLEIDDEG